MIIYVIDFINNFSFKNGHSMAIDFDDKYISITGWAADIDMMNPVCGVYFKVKDKIYKATYGTKRADVADAYNNNLLVNSGFNIFIPIDDTFKDVQISLEIETQNGERIIYENIAQLFISSIDSSITRNVISKMYVKGNGIEIGALDKPLKIYNNSTVTYVDRMSNEDLVLQYPHLNGIILAEVKIIDDGENLSHIKDASQDFIIANHFLEHCENPIFTIINFLRVLKKEGIIFFAIPNKELTFDKDRDVTTLEHLIYDFENGPAESKEEHFRDFVSKTNLIKDLDIEKSVKDLIKSNYSIHYHVWDEMGVINLFTYCKSKFQFSIELFIKINNEFIIILKK